MKILRTLFLAAFLIGCTQLFAQHGRGHQKGNGRHKGNGHPHRHGKRGVVKRSVYRPARVVVYHPHWRPAYAYHRRWVYFPRHNFYWDNWRNHYVYYNGNTWVSQPSAPPVVVNVNLEKENSKELKEDDDDVDDVYKSNDSHKTEYKPE